MSIQVEMRFNNRAIPMIEADIENAIKQAGNMIVNEIKRVLTGQRSGKRYRVPHTSRYYQASRAGEPPATVTADLRRSWIWTTSGHGFDTKLTIGSNIKYAVFLEKGTSRMAPRPYVSVAGRNKKDAVANLFKNLT